MTGLSDLVALLIGKLYGKIQERAPLPTIIFAVVRHLFISPPNYSQRSHALFCTARAQVFP